MSDVFLEQAARGENRWWRYLATLGAIGLGLLLFQIPYGLLLFVSAKNAAPGGLRMDPVKGTFENLPFPLFAVGLLSFAVIIGVLGLCMRKIHRRPFLSLVGPDDRLRVGPVVKTAAATFAFMAVAVGINFALDREAFTYRFDAGAFFPAFALGLLLLPIQCAAEELVYRGWLMQGMHRLTRRRWAAVGISSMIFGASHLLNPEASENPLLAQVYYVGVGVLLALVTLKMGRLEYAIGLHVGVNLAGFFLAPVNTMVVQPPSVLVDVAPSIPRDLAILAVMSALTWVATRRSDTKPQVGEAQLVAAAP